jgi:hypothetical protein
MAAVRRPFARRGLWILPATLAIALVLVMPGTAAAVTDTVTYSGTTALSGPSGSPSPALPAQFGFRWTLHVDTQPPGSQPDSAAATTIYFAKAISSNGQHVPSCSQAQIDGQASFPSPCHDAIVGYGTATMYAGSPGSPTTNSVREDLSALLVNGDKGGRLLMVISSNAGAPVAINNRVIPGTVVAAADPYGFAVRFDVPQDLQNQLGLSLTLTDISVTMPGTARAFAVGSTMRTGSFLEITDCAGQIPIRAVTDFTQSTGGGSSISSDGGAACQAGTFEDPYAPTSGAALPPPQAGKTATVAPATPCDSPSGAPIPPEQCTNLCPASGCVVRIRVPGSSQFVELGSDGQIPIGATVDVSQGAIRLTTAARGGRTQTGIFYGAVFTLAQTRRDPTTELKLPLIRQGGCRGSAGATARKPGAKTKKSLWSNVDGRFRTRGQFAAATALGTKWLTSERCDGTLVTVRTGKVAVRDLKRQRTVVLRPRQSYLARPGRRA